MLDTLIESRSTKSRNSREALASGAIHIGLIALATYFTTTRAAATPIEERLISIPFVSPAAPPVKTPNRAATSASNKPSVAAPRHVSISFAVPTNIPPVDLELGPVRNDDFPAPSHGITGDVPAGPSRGEGEPYEAMDVDTQVRAIAGSAFPKYPASLRASGIEGQVVAQFIVDERGNAVKESARIISSTNDLFSESVIDALVRMRFAPARLAGRPVRQTVQQLFVFKLDR